MKDTLTEVVYELRHYIPAADRYHGAYIHKGWAQRIEEGIGAKDAEIAALKADLSGAMYATNKNGDAATKAYAEIAALKAALNALLAITQDSHGVAGYHRNGDVAEWDEFPEVEQARAVIAQVVQPS